MMIINFLTGVKWLRLLKSKKKVPWLTANFDRMVKEDSDSEEEKANRFVKEKGILSLLVVFFFFMTMQ